VSHAKSASRRGGRRSGTVAPNLGMISPPSSSEPLYRAKPFKLFPVGQGQVVVYLTEDDRAILTPYRTARVLPFCTAYRTIQQHVATIGRSAGVSVDRLGLVREALTALIEAGVIQRKPDSIAYQIAPAVQRHAGARISAVGILTAERPAQILQCVESVARNVSEAGRTIEIVVMDDSRELDYTGHLGCLRTYAKQYGLDVRYATRRHRAQFCETLARSGLPRDVCQHALLGAPDALCSIGATRNAILSDTSGRLMMMLDDDMVWRFSLHPQHAAGCKFVGHAGPTDTWTFPDRGATSSERSWVRCDLLGEHETLLGKPLIELCGSEGGSARFDDDICDDMLTALRSGRGRVLASMGGVIGDSGMDSNIALLLCGGETRARLLQSEEVYRAALCGREILRVARCATVTHESTIMGGNLGLDNTTLLPPFIPNFRGEDSIFGALVAKCILDAYYGHVPVAVFHAAGDKRENPSFLASCVVGMADVYLAALGSLALLDSVEDPAERMELIGRHLKHVGALKPGSFIPYIRGALLNLWSARLTGVQNVLDDHDGRPGLWLDDIAQVRHKLIEAMAAKAFWVPRELANRGSESDIRYFVQRALYLFGETCESWPEIVRASRECAEKDARISVSICC